MKKRLYKSYDHSTLSEDCYKVCIQSLVKTNVLIACEGFENAQRIQGVMSFKTLKICSEPALEV